MAGRVLWSAWWEVFLLSFLSTLTAGFPADSLLWGPYRPNLYFGIQPRIPESLSTALLWSRVDEYQTVQQSQLLR